MDLRWCIAPTGSAGAGHRPLVGQASAEQARWKPSPRDWSILEVINHLGDEEREDFRTRLDLSSPTTPTRRSRRSTPRAGDPAATTGRDPGASLARFLDERQHSLDWLRSLAAPDWSRPSARPALRAGDLLAAWVAHDLLHLRQLTELHYAWLAEHAAPYGIDYAGPWQEEITANA